MKTFRALGALLTYPTQEQIDALPEIAVVLKAEKLLAEPMCAAVGCLIAHLEKAELIDLQDDYVALFDRTRSLSLHLYEHLYGEARERGQAMVRLQTLYRFHGFTHTVAELPDYLPLFCEFLSLMPERTARTILSDAAATIEALHRRAVAKGTPYACVFAALTTLASKDIDRQLLAEIMRGGGDDDTLEALDRAWEEAPVTFEAGAAAKSLEGTKCG